MMSDFISAEISYSLGQSAKAPQIQILFCLNLKWSPISFIFTYPILLHTIIWKNYKVLYNWIEIWLYVLLSMNKEKANLCFDFSSFFKNNWKLLWLTCLSFLVFLKMHVCVLLKSVCMLFITFGTKLKYVSHINSKDEPFCIFRLGHWLHKIFKTTESENKNVQIRRNFFTFLM